MDATKTRNIHVSAYNTSTDEDALYDTRMPSSVRRYRTYRNTIDEPKIEQATLIQRRASRVPPGLRAQGTVSRALTPSDTRKRARPAIGRISRRHPLMVILLGGVLTLLLVMLAGKAASWWQDYQNTLHYGYPRMSQFDAVVGHNDSADHPTHFILLNLRCHVQVIEIAGGDPAQTRTYHGPTLFGTGCDTIPVTGEIREESGKRDLVLHIQDQQVVFINDGKTFQR